MAPLGNTWENKYAEELRATAKALAAPGKGILAADESTGTIGKRVRLLLRVVCVDPSRRVLSPPHCLGTLWLIFSETNKGFMIGRSRVFKGFSARCTRRATYTVPADTEHSLFVYNQAVAWLVYRSISSKYGVKCSSRVLGWRMRRPTVGTFARCFLRHPTCPNTSVVW